jgi:alpha-L-rhamnosidase
MNMKNFAQVSVQAPTNLRVQDNAEQLGVEVANPSFAWYVSGIGRGERQTAYRIIVTSCKNNIDSNLGDLWDSGKIISVKQYGVKYDGCALESNTKYWWKVMTWDKNNNQSSWSQSTTFITGFLNPSDWTADWISASSNTVSVPYMLRKEFSVSKTISYATANICGIGQFELYMNGEKVGNHELDPGWTDYSKSQQYVTFDVTNLLQSGDNAVGVWLADGFMDLGNHQGRYQYFSHSDGGKRMIMELNIRYTDGTVHKIKSDGTWKTSKGAITYSHTFGGEDYDAREEKAGWNSCGYNDLDWINAIVTSSPGGTLCSQFQPPIKVVETLKPISMIQKGNNVEVNMGKTYAGIFDIEISGTAGKRIKVTLSEDGGSYNAYCQYTLKGDEVEVFRPRFWYFGQKYITIENASITEGSSLPYISSVKGYVLSNSAKQTGTFSSSSSMYNKIFDINKQGIVSNMYSFITDCPHREKSPWMNDINFTAPSYTCLFDVHTLFRKICKDIQEAQYEDGMIPSLAPQYQVWAEGFLDAPFYGISAMRFPWLLYQQFGDIDILHKQYAVAKKALANIMTHASGYLAAYGLGDWLDPDPVSIEFVDTCVYYDFVNTMQKWAAVIENFIDADFYSILAENIKSAFNAKYFNNETHSYGSQQTANAVPLYHRMQPQREESNILNALINSIVNSDYHINCGQNGHGYMLQVLSRYGRDDIVGRIHTNTTGPSFGYYVTQGKTNTPEKWDGTGSQQHQMNNVIPEWICGCLAGITAAKPGFEEISIRPTSVTSYVPDSVSYTLETIRGIVISHWTKGDSNYNLNVTVPVNSTAKVYIPTFGSTDIIISEGGTVLWNNGTVVGITAGISYNGLDGTYPSSNNYVVFNVGSGTYNFEARVAVEIVPSTAM